MGKFLKLLYKIEIRDSSPWIEHDAIRDKIWEIRYSRADELLSICNSFMLTLARIDIGEEWMYSFGGGEDIAWAWSDMGG